MGRARVTVALLLAMLVSGAVAPAAEATFPGHNGEILVRTGWFRAADDESGDTCDYRWLLVDPRGGRSARISSRLVSNEGPGPVFGPTGALATAAPTRSGQAQWWLLKPSEWLRRIWVGPRHPGGCIDVAGAWSWSGTKLAYDRSPGVQLLDVARRRSHVVSRRGWLSCPTWSHRGDLAFLDRGVRVLTAGGRRPELVVRAPADAGEEEAFSCPAWVGSSRALVVSSARDGTVYLWRAGQGTQTLGEWGSVVPSPRTSYAFRWQWEHPLQVGDLETGRFRTVTGGWFLSWAPNGRLATVGGRGRRLTVVDARTARTRPLDVPGRMNPVWSPDSRLLAYVQDTKLRVADVRTGHSRTVAQITSQDEIIDAVDWQALR